MKTKICSIFNLAPHYRAPIYNLMDEQLGCDFYFGDSLGNHIKLMDYKSLRGFQKIVRNKRLGKTGFMWQSGVWKLIFKPYKHYIVTGSPALLSTWVLAILAIPLGKKVYAWSHGMKKPAVTKGDVFRKTFYRLFHKILLYGDYSKGVMEKEGFNSTQLAPIYNSLDYERQLEVRENLTENNVYSKHFNNQNPVIIYVGRIQKSKKLDMLVLAIKSLLKTEDACNLVFVGSNIDDNEVQKLVIENGLENMVWFYGPSYDEKEIGNLIYNADVCVSPGPIGLTALHALTYGCPVISNDRFEEQMPEFEAITSGKNGDFFKDNNLDDLVLTIKRWVNNDHLEKKRIRLEAYRSINEKWNTTNQITILKKLLNV